LGLLAHFRFDAKPASRQITVWLSHKPALVTW